MAKTERMRPRISMVGSSVNEVVDCAFHHPPRRSTKIINPARFVASAAMNSRLLGVDLGRPDRGINTPAPA